MISLNYELRECTGGNNIPENDKPPYSNVWYQDICQNEKELENLI